MKGDIKLHVLEWGVEVLSLAYYFEFNQGFFLQGVAADRTVAIA
jgi:hypothetical protein